GFNDTDVVFGNNSAEAFSKIQAPVYGAGDIDFSYEFFKNTTSDGMEIDLNVTNLKTDPAEEPVNVTVDMVVYSQKTNVTINNSTSGTNPADFTSDPAYPYLGTGTNYSIVNYTLFPQETKGKTIKLNFELGNFSSRDVYFRFVVNLTFINETNGTESQIFEEDPEYITFYTTVYPPNSMENSEIQMDFTIPTQGNESLGIEIPIFLENTNISDPLDVIVNLTIFSHDFTVLTDNLTVQVPGPGNDTISGIPNLDDPFYEENNGYNYTVFNSTIDSLNWIGQTIYLDLNITGSTPVELICYMTLIIDNSVVTTGLRVIKWTPD
ncbi:MAG: hypothetical protein ACFFCS_13095, partial [Candidatus Hodarchaeota archaeon]